MNGRQLVYAFEDGNGKNKMLLGGKGANLCEMTQLGQIYNTRLKQRSRSTEQRGGN